MGDVVNIRGVDEIEDDEVGLIAGAGGQIRLVMPATQEGVKLPSNQLVLVAIYTLMDEDDPLVHMVVKKANEILAGKVGLKH